VRQSGVSLRHHSLPVPTCAISRPTKDPAQYQRSDSTDHPKDQELKAASPDRAIVDHCRADRLDLESRAAMAAGWLLDLAPPVFRQPRFRPRLLSASARRPESARHEPDGAEADWCELTQIVRRRREQPGPDNRP
jgi:hypothetical protein